MPTNCLTSLLGLAPAPTSCLPFPSGDTAFITDSLTGLYLYNVPGLSLQCGATEWVERLNDAREEAGRKVRTALAMGLSGGLVARHTWIGTLGQTTFTGTDAGNVARVVLKTRHIPGAALRLNTVQLLTDVELTEPVSVMLDGQVVGSYTSGTAALTNAVLPCDGLTHVLQAELPVGVRPRLNKLSCGCGGDSALKLLGGYVENVKQAMGGFVLGAQAVCTAPEQLCYAVSTPEGSTVPVDEDLRMQVGYFLQYTAALEVLYKEMADGTAGRLTGLQQDAIAELADRYEKKANEYKVYLTGATGIGRIKHPCYVCVNTGPMILKST